MHNSNGIPAIETSGIVKSYGNINALDGVDLRIEKGEAFGLLGPNGAGKTTLISILSTVIRATRGTASVAGHDVVSEQSAVRNKIGILFQDPSLDERLTARENLMLHCSLYGIPPRDRGARMDEMLDLVELTQRQHDLVKKFSGGMRRRLEIARSLLHMPEVLFLDEPTIGLDPQTRDHIWGHLEKLGAGFGITTVLTTHYMDEADRLCGRIAIIDHGKIVAVDTPDALKKSLGDSVVTLNTDKPSELVERLGLSKEECAKATITQGVLTVYTAEPEAVLSRAFKIADADGLQVSSVGISRPTLNNVFLKFTGHGLRDAADGPAAEMAAVIGRMRTSRAGR